MTDFSPTDIPAFGRARSDVLDANFNAIQAALASKANSASPALTGTPTAPTAAPGTNTTQLATTEFVMEQSFSATGAESAANKDASGGYAGLTLLKLNLKNALGTITSWFTTAATVARTWTMPDKDGTVAMTSDITGGTLAGSFTTLAASGAATFPAGALVTGVALTGYGTGSGGGVTQATSKSTSVTLNKPTGQITMHAESLASGATVSFTLNNTTVTSNDWFGAVITAGYGSAADYNVWCVMPTSNQVSITLKNMTAGALATAVRLTFISLKGATA